MAKGAARPLVLDVFSRSSNSNIDRRKCKRTVPLQVLCLGLSRTGTQSLRDALLDLGYRDVYHQTSMNVDNPRDAEMWVDAYRAKFEGQGIPFTRAEWDQLLGHCMAVSDVPCITFWRELMDAYPEAKLILTVRDNADVWYQSFTESSMRLLGGLYGNTWLAYFRNRLLTAGPNDRYAQLLLKYDEAYAVCFQDYLNKTRYGRACYDRHNSAVIQAAKDQGRELLVYNVKQGFEPLCNFLDVESPRVPFPRLNEKTYFQRGTNKIHGAIFVGIVLRACSVVVPISGVLMGMWYARRWL